MRICTFIYKIHFYSIYLDRIPTSSMLVRIYKAPRGPSGEVLGLDNSPGEKWTDMNVLIQAPVYQEGVYSTQYFYNTALENKMFYIRRGRKDPKLTLVAQKMLQQNKINPNMVIFYHLSHFYFYSLKNKCSKPFKK